MAQRIKVEDAWRRVQSGEALLVCAYDSEEMCKGMRLERAMTLGELNAKLPSLAKEQQIIFYCK